MPLKELYRKVDSFQDNLRAELKEFSQCKKGCSRCCMVELSVFQVEADAIRSWFEDQDPQCREKLSKSWNTEVPKNQCAFLVDDACTIYEARPLICRTQGLPLRYQEGPQTFVDVCPLNEEMLGVLSTTDVVNLDLINLILAQIEKEAGSERPRKSLRDLRQQLLRK